MHDLACSHTESRLTRAISSYFYYPNYEIAAAEYTENKKIAFSIAEFLTFNGGFYGNPDAKDFTGSALVSQNGFIIVFKGVDKPAYTSLLLGYHRRDRLHCLRRLLSRNLR